MARTAPILPSSSCAATERCCPHLRPPQGLPRCRLMGGTVATRRPISALAARSQPTPVDVAGLRIFFPFPGSADRVCPREDDYLRKRPKATGKKRRLCRCLGGCLFRRSPREVRLLRALWRCFPGLWRRCEHPANHLIGAPRGLFLAVAIVVIFGWHATRYRPDARLSQSPRSGRFH